MRSFCRQMVALLCLLAPFCASSEPDKAQQDDQAKTVLKSNTRLVVVDVVVNDSKGTPVANLKSQDFTVLEDGRPQQISIFSFQQPESGSIVESTTHLPANVFTNAPVAKPTSLNVILLDALNGQFASRSYARDQLIKFLENDQTRQPVAVYALENHLKLLHDFTTETREVVSAIRGYKPAVVNHLDSIKALASPFTQKGEFQTSDRNIQTTLAALDFLGQALKGYPGRKNLIWLSEGFPMEMFPDLFPSAAAIGIAHNTVSTDTPGFGNPISSPAQADMIHASQVSSTNWANSDYSEQVRKVANELMNAQVAVYPIDAAGVGKVSQTSNLSTMRQVAERTGGKTFVNQNDLQASIRGSIDDGSTYYTLAYYPDNKNWSGQLRQIDIKTTRPGVSLRYRHGYYALDPAGFTKEQDSKKMVEDFSRGLALDMPSATAVLFRTVLTSPVDNTQKVVVNFAIDPHTITFVRQEDGGQQANLSCAVVVFSEKGSLVTNTLTTVPATVKADDFPKLMDSTFPCRSAVELKPGKYSLRLGVLDRMSRLMGTTTASVTVPLP